MFTYNFRFIWYIIKRLCYLIFNLFFFFINQVDFLSDKLSSLASGAYVFSLTHLVIAGAAAFLLGSFTVIGKNLFIYWLYIDSYEAYLTCISITKCFY